MEDEKKFTVTKNGEPLDPELYTWDSETRTFSTKESGLVLDFSRWRSCTFDTGDSCTFDTGNSCTFDTGDSCTFNTGDSCTFNTGDSCTFDTGNSCTFNTGGSCTFKTGDDCTFDTGGYCTFNTVDNCTFNTGDSCTFDTGSNCTFDTGDNCTFDTGSNCTFDTGDNCTFNTSSNCTFDTGDNCVAIRRDIFEVIKLEKIIKYQLPPYRIPGYIKDGYYYLNNKKQYKAIVADNILSEILSKKKNKNLTVYKVKNYNQEKESYLVKEETPEGNIYSHGETIKQAKESLIFKISSRDTSAYKDLKVDDVVTFEEAIKMYRVITGACEFGTKTFVDSLEKKKKKYKISEIIEITKGQYNSDKFANFFIRS